AQTVHTDGDGQFGATLALPASAGRQRITVGFVGRGELAPTSVELLLDGAAAAAPEPATPSAATPPADTRRRTTLSAELDDTSLHPGELLSITGSLRAGDAPVPSREVHVWLAD